MADDAPHLDALVERLLADEQYLNHPLRDALARLWAQDRERLERLERIAAISDGYQRMAIESAHSVTERFNRKLRQFEKAVRISDGYQTMMRELYAKLEELSTRDQLTGMANRRLILERLDEEVQRASRHRQPLAIALLDVDRFKQVNDRYGHAAGDAVLVAFAQAMAKGLRDYDMCARWGGEEFLMLLPNTDADTAATVLDRLQERIRGFVIPVDGQSVSVTASIGLTMHQDGETIAETISRADGALMEAKQTGRDRCITR